MAVQSRVFRCFHSKVARLPHICTGRSLEPGLLASSPRFHRTPLRTPRVQPVTARLATFDEHMCTGGARAVAVGPFPHASAVVLAVLVPLLILRYSCPRRSFRNVAVPCPLTTFA